MRTAGWLSCPADPFSSLPQMQPYPAATVCAAVRDHVSGRYYKEICAQYGMATHTLFKWVRMYHGCDERQISRMIEMQRTLHELRFKLVKASSKLHALTATVLEMVPIPRDRTAWAKHMMSGGLGFSAACAAVGLSESTFLHKHRTRDYTELKQHMVRMRARYPDWGLGKLVPLMRSEGAVIGMRLAWKLYRELGLQYVGRRRPIKRQLPTRPLSIPTKPNHTWSMDYAMQKLPKGRRVWVLNVLDDFNREGLACVLQRRPTAAMLVAELDRLIAVRGRPKRIRCDNGQQFVAGLTRAWARTKRVHLLYIERGKPTQNALIERFHYMYRVEVLRHHSFVTLPACQRAASKWLRIYNNERPHGSLGNLSPRAYLRSKGFRTVEVLQDS